MVQLTLHRKAALAGAIVAVLCLAGAAAAGSPPHSSHASQNAVTHAAGATDSGTDANGNANNDHGKTVSAAAHSSLTGGPHNNHGGYVSCVARGGSNCTSSNPTLPSHPEGSDELESPEPSD
jgi:hypothetical protein